MWNKDEGGRVLPWCGVVTMQKYSFVSWVNFFFRNVFGNVIANIHVAPGAIRAWSKARPPVCRTITQAIQWGYVCLSQRSRIFNLFYPLWTSNN